MHVCILGAGGLGSLVGARLAQSGVAVTLVGREAHVDAIRRNGLCVEGIRGPSLVRDHLHAVTDPAQVPGTIDYLLLTVKTSDTAATLAGAEVLGATSPAVLSLQNSVTKDRLLAEWIGERNVIGASTTESATLIAPGRVRHTGTAPTAFYFGEARRPRIGTGPRSGDSLPGRRVRLPRQPMPSRRWNGRNCCRPR